MSVLTKFAKVPSHAEPNAIQELLLASALQSVVNAKVALTCPSYDPTYQPLIDAIGQAADDGRCLTRAGFDSILRTSPLTASQMAGHMGVYCRLAMKGVRPLSAPELLREEAQRAKLAEATKALREKDPERAKELYAEAGAPNPKVLDKIYRAAEFEVSRGGKGKGEKIVGSLKIVRMSEIQEKPVEWLVPDLVPLGGLTVIAGEGETGKSTAVASYVARLTSGQQLPDRSPAQEPIEVIYVGVEEDVERVLVPRLRKFGADLTKIHYAYGIKTVKNGKEVLLPWTFEQIDMLRETLAANPKIKLVIFDPMGTYFGTADSYKDTEVQRLLQPLNKLSQDHGVTMFAIAHLNKGEARSIKHRILGSVAIVNTARCVIGVVKDRDERSKGYLGIVKCNYGGKRKALPYTIDAEGGIAFQTELDTDLESLAKTTYGTTGRGAVESDTAEQLIESMLRPGEMPAPDIEAQCHAVGISRASMYRAAEKLEAAGRLVRGVREFGGPSVWTLVKAADSPF